MHRLIAILLACACLPAYAADVTLTCTPPTTFTDGKPITGAISYKFYRGTTAGTYTVSQASPTCATTFTGVPPGPNHFAVTAIVGGMESGFSAATSVTAPNPTPNPPTNLLSQLIAWLRSFFGRHA
jgi:hypothetical protein